MGFTDDFKIRVKIVDSKPDVKLSGKPILHSELRVIFQLIEKEYYNLLKEKRNVIRPE